MKLRLRGDSLRLRVTRGELDRLRAGDGVSERVRFGDGPALDYRLEAGDVAAATATLEISDGGVVIRVRLPTADVRAWADSNREGIEALQPLAGPDALRVVVQKDFACLSPRAGDDDADTFPHPEAGERSC